MKNTAYFAGVIVIVTVLSACSDQAAAINTQQPVQSRKGIPGIKIGIPQITIPDSIAELLCLDVDSALGIPESSAVAKWVKVMAEYGIAVKDQEFGGSNELHDCQGLIRNVNGKDRYVTFGTIWASDFLKQPEFADPTVVAAISMGGPGYSTANFTLNPGKNCILLQGDDPDDTGTGWSAWIVPISYSDKCPTGGTTPTGTPLKVFRDPNSSPAAAARWVDTGSTYYIGMQCGADYFCLIGVPVAGEIPPGYNGFWGAARDQQRLAKKNAAGQLEPSGLKGLIMATYFKKPDGTIADEALVASYEAKFERVLAVTIKGKDDEALEQYANKWGVTKAALKKPKLGLYFKHTAGAAADAGWVSKWETSILPPREVKFNYAHHSGIHTARWRWKPDDEGQWRQCGSGCCAGN